MQENLQQHRWATDKYSLINIFAWYYFAIYNISKYLIFDLENDAGTVADPELYIRGCKLRAWPVNAVSWYVIFW